jgi:hypothetical protein
MPIARAGGIGLHHLERGDGATARPIEDFLDGNGP